MSNYRFVCESCGRERWFDCARSKLGQPRRCQCGDRMRHTRVAPAPVVQAPVAPAPSIPHPTPAPEPQVAPSRRGPNRITNATVYAAKTGVRAEAGAWAEIDGMQIVNTPVGMEVDKDARLTVSRFSHEFTDDYQDPDVEAE